MSSPPIKYTGPKIADDIPWEVRQHIQLLYQKLGNHTQAFQQVAQQIAGIKPGSTTTNIIEEGGGGGPIPPSSGFIGQGLINDQTGATGYATQPGDNGILLIVNDASPVAVTLTTNAAPFYLIVTNFGAGTATLTPSTGTINGGASLALLQNQTVYVACDSTNWETTALFAPPQNTPAVAHEWLNSYTSATGAFTRTQPAFTDISGTAATTQIGTGTPASGDYVDGATGAWTPLPGGGGGITALTGDVTATGPGSVAATLANTAVTPGSYTNTNLTVDSKGRITAASNGSGAGPSFADNETPSGTINGTNVTFTLAHSPSPAGSLILVLAGLTQWQNGSGDYTLSTNTITFAVAPTLGPLVAWYRF